MKHIYILETTSYGMKDLEGAYTSKAKADHAQQDFFACNEECPDADTKIIRMLVR